MKRFFLENLPIKLLSLFLALILFVLVREDRVKEFEVDIPVVTARTPDDFVFVGDLPKKVSVRLRGKWSKILQALERKDTPYVLDMGEVKDGDVVFFDENRIQRIVGPHGPNIVSITPTSTTIRLEAKVLKRVRVRPDLIGEAARGYLLKRNSVRIEPADVAIRGPAESVRDIEEILTAPINVAGLDRDLIREDVALRQPARPYLTMEPSRVRVEILIEEVTTSALIADASVALRNCPAQHECRLQPERVPVQLLGPMLSLERLRESQGEGLLWVDAGAAVPGPGRFDVPIRIESPPGVVVTLSTPGVTLVVVSNEPVAPPALRDLVPPPVLEGPPEPPGPPPDAPGDAGPTGGPSAAPVDAGPTGDPSAAPVPDPDAGRE